MEVDDRVYGPATVDEPVLDVLVQTGPVQRLRDISQAGPQHLFMDKPRLTRYEHSVGVMLLLRQHGAPLEEQVAGLLHDVPHTAFSHLADFVYETDNHEFHERFLEEMVRDSEIPAVLERHGLAVDAVLDEDRFPLLERDAPDLCADRIDYFLRDFAAYGGADVSGLRDAVTTHDGMFVLDDRDAAERFALQYIEADERFWADPAEVAVFHVFADAVRRALDAGILTRDDLFETDDHVWQRLRDADDPAVQDRLDTLRGEVSVDVGVDDPDMVVETKCRWIDPPVLADGDVMRVTDYSERLQDRTAAHRDRVEGGFRVRLADGA